MMMRKFVIVVWVVAAALTVTGPVFAEAHVQTSMRFIAMVTDDAVDALEQKGLSDDELKKRLRKVLADNLALNLIGRVVLGRYWSTSSDEEKKEFLALFQEITVNTWSERLRLLDGQRFTVISAANLENPNPSLKFAFVKTNFGSGGEQLPVGWQVVTSNNRFKVSDIVVSGISLVQEQKDQFGSVLRQNDGSVSVLNGMLRELALSTR